MGMPSDTVKDSDARIRRIDRAAGEFVGKEWIGLPWYSTVTSTLATSKVRSTEARDSPAKTVVSPGIGSRDRAARVAAQSLVTSHSVRSRPAVAADIATERQVRDLFKR